MRSTDPDSIMHLSRRNIEDVPISWLKQLPGNKFRADDVEITALGKDITANSMRDPLIINVGKDSRTAELGEGNHRLEALIREGYTHAPARVVVGNNWGKGKGHVIDADLIPKSGEYFSGDASPSDVFRSLAKKPEPAARSSEVIRGPEPSSRPKPTPVQPTPVQPTPVQPTTARQTTPQQAMPTPTGGGTPRPPGPPPGPPPGTPPPVPPGPPPSQPPLQAATPKDLSDSLWAKVVRTHGAGSTAFRSRGHGRIP